MITEPPEVSNPKTNRFETGG